MLDVLDREKLRAVLAINGAAIERYTPVARAAVERGWEFIGHGFTQKNMQKVANERDDIRRTASAIRAVTGKNPRGAAILDATVVAGPVGLLDLAAKHLADRR